MSDNKNLEEKKIVFDISKGGGRSIVRYFNNEWKEVACIKKKGDSLEVMYYDIKEEDNCEIGDAKEHE